MPRHSTVLYSLLAAGSALATNGYFTHALEQEVNGKGSIPMPFGGGEADVWLKEDILSVGYTFAL